MAWDFDPDKPLYLQIVENFKLKIINGEYPPGARLASVRELAAEAAVNPNTMQKALSELERKIYPLYAGVGFQRATGCGAVARIFKTR